MQERIDELTLLLLYLTSFEENAGLGETNLRSWKGYPFDTLDKLSNNNLIFSSNRAKSVYLTESGIEKAKKLMQKYNIQTENNEF
ncbi:transposase [Arthrobacter citreus]|nr:transposase [Arthrobacter citreus]